MWRLVRRGFGEGGCGEMWWRESVEEGPEERRRGWVGWKVRDAIADFLGVGASAWFWEGSGEGAYGLGGADIFEALDVDYGGAELALGRRDGGRVLEDRVGVLEELGEGCGGEGIVVVKGHVAGRAVAFRAGSNSAGSSALLVGCFSSRRWIRPFWNGV